MLRIAETESGDGDIMERDTAEKKQSGTSIQDVIQAIESLKDQRFKVTELESLTTIMQRKVKSLIPAGHNFFEGMDTTMELWGVHCASRRRNSRR